MTFLFHAHSGFRYIVLLLGAAAFLYALYGLLTGRPVDARMRILGGLFAGAFHLQILLGIALLFSGTFGAMVAGHVLLMVFAAACAQLVPSVMRRRPPEKRTYLPYAIGTVAAIALAVFGILAIGRPVLG
jgi:hypothetical protein